MTTTTLDIDQTAHSHTGDATETVVKTYTVPADTLVNGQLTISALVTRAAAGSSTITYRARYGGLGGTIYGSIGIGTGQLSQQLTATIRADGATNAQVGFLVNSSALVTSAEDTTNTVDIVLTVQCANAADTGIVRNSLIQSIE